MRPTVALRWWSKRHQGRVANIPQRSSLQPSETSHGPREPRQQQPRGGLAKLPQRSSLLPSQAFHGPREPRQQQQPQPQPRGGFGKLPQRSSLLPSQIIHGPSEPRQRQQQPPRGSVGAGGGGGAGVGPTTTQQQPLLPSRIVFGSCASQRDKWEQRRRGDSECCWKAMYDGPYPPELVILMGDNIYADAFDSVEEAYHQLLSNNAFRTLHERCQVIATMDDNDYTDDLERGKKAFLDQFVFASPEDVRRQPGRGIYDSHVWRGPYQEVEDQNKNPSGDVFSLFDMKDQVVKGKKTANELALQVILLDVRYHATPDDLLGETQWEWLSDQLQQPDDVALRIIVSPIQVLPTAHDWDCWNNIPEARRRLLDMITLSTTTSTILLSGDRHVAAMYQDSNSLFEVTSSSLTHTVRGKASSKTLDEEFDPHYQLQKYVYENNFGEISIDWAHRQAYVSIRSVATRKKVQRHTISF
jgi:alkaline phosphatase D